MGRMKSGLFIGTSGYCYAHWSKGAFYPKGMKQRDYLPFYAEHFNTVELNISFYRRPIWEFLHRWAEITPSDFRFAAKLNRMVTHYQKLRNCDKTLAGEKVLREGLGEKLAVVLAQLPPNLPADTVLLKDFLDLLRTDCGRWIPRLAVEFRHPTWQTDEVYQLLSDHGVAICLADWGSTHFTRPNDAPFLYIRRHSGQDHGCYTSDQIRQDARLIGPHLAAGKQVYVYYNNDLNAFAVRNARELAALLCPR